LLPLLDEADILDRNLAWYAEAGIATAAFDNASSDDTHSLCQDALRDGRLARYKRSEQSVTWPTIGDRLISLAAQLEPDLVLVAGADEFIEEARGLPLRTAVETDLASGYDILEVRTMEFCLTDQDDPGVEDPLLRMRRYSPHVAVLPDRGCGGPAACNGKNPTGSALSRLVAHAHHVAMSIAITHCAPLARRSLEHKRDD